MRSFCGLGSLSGLAILLLLCLLDASPVVNAAGISGGLRRLQTSDAATVAPLPPEAPVATPAPHAPVAPPVLPSLSPSDAVASNDTSFPLVLLHPLSRSVAAPRFQSSSSGQPMVVWEPAPSFWPRGLMVLLVCLQGIAALVWMLFHGLAWLRKPLLAHSRAVQQLLRSVLLWTVISVVLHTFHYADNIWSPVAYCEPAWLYRAWVATEMEITFGFFTPLTVIALGLAGIVVGFPVYGPSSTMGLVMARALFGWSLVYLGGSALSGGHYAVEPPSAYALQANVAIIGEVVAATIVFIQAWRVHKMVNAVVHRPGVYLSVDNDERTAL